ncbi:hypothetical protein [Micromonospora sp. WMMD714]|uniref:hypothetical protein n=1 Tax=Micromonospora sp. WMMD714 TaxID=3016097 RepID=UPI00249AEF17|nr:hypothetical protein [Micromonospora sp. WMMD714]WFE64870.1 hypothetical protein O7625_17055 [Micromonospora sp. WMMD714]
MLTTVARRDRWAPAGQRVHSDEREATMVSGTEVRREVVVGSPARPAGRRRWLVPVLLAVGWLLGVGWRMWLSRHVPLPIAHTDEDSYLHTARALAGGPGGFSSENGPLRRVGYPLLISPAFLGERDFADSYRLVQLINAAVNATVLPLAYLLVRRLVPVRRAVALAAAAVAATLPATVFYAGVAMIDAVLAPLVLAWLLAVHHWVRRPGPLVAAGAGALVGAFHLLHSRGLVIVGVHVGLVLLLFLRRRISPAQVLAAVLPVLAAALLNAVVIRLLGDRVYLLGDPPGGGTVRAVASGPGLLRVGAAVATQLWYLVVITFGLAGVAWAGAVTALLRRPAVDTSTATTPVPAVAPALAPGAALTPAPAPGAAPVLAATLAPAAAPAPGAAVAAGGSRSAADVGATRWTFGVALVTSVGVAAGASVILAGITTKPLDAIYGRYVQMLAPFWLLVGVGLLVAATPRSRWRRAAVAAGVLLAGATLIAARLAWVASRGHELRYGGFGAPDLMALTGGWREFRPFTGALVGLVGCLLLVVAVRRPRWRVPVLAALVAVNLGTMQVITDRLVRPMVAATAPTPRVADVGVRPGDRVWASLGVQWVLRFNLSHQVTWADVRWFVDNPPADADVVFVRWAPGEPDDWDGARHGFVRMGGNVEQHWAAWRRR